MHQRLAGADAYREQAARHEAERARQERRSRHVSYGRLALFLGGAACLIAAFPGHARTGPLIAAGAALLLGFFALVWWHGRVEAAERHAAARARVNRDAAARVERAWGEMGSGSPEGPGQAHPYAADLDLFGHASLFRLLGSATTEAGRQTLSAWLLRPAAAATVRERQAAVRELAGAAAYRERLATLGLLVEPRPHELDAFLSWAESTPWLQASRWLPWAARVVSTSTVVLVAAQAAGVVDRFLWIYPLVAAIGLMARYEARIHHTFARAFARERIFQEHAALFAHLEALPPGAARLAELREALDAGGLSAHREMARLGQLMRMADLRFQAIFHFPINALTLWDFHVLAALEAWQRRNGRRLRTWFAVLGEVDGLSAFGWLAHDNPGWAFPEIDESADRLEARDLGHPLLPEGGRVANDVEVGPPGTLVLVTGSNMSGKSTLLRAVGANTVLALAGGPVCARRLVLPPLAIFTSMRVQDSLEAGVSYFMAALQRLKLVVTAAERSPRDGGMVLYLLDEVLQGTNTAERQVAVRHILTHLLGLPVIGLVTTHDLELAASPDLAPACQAVHFSEGVEREGAGARLSFDYRLRPGVATSRNALKLLELVGLGARPSARE
jgi:hypothetical protein